MVEAPMLTYQEIYEIPKRIKDRLFGEEIPPDVEVEIMPSYYDLYTYDRGFYLLTEEEGKANYEEAIFEIEKAIENMSEEEVRALSIYDMMGLTTAHDRYKTELKVNPVDSIIALQAFD